MKWNFLKLILIVFVIQNVSAIIISEIMYNPYDSIQCSDADCEWIELYNDESSSINLTNWTIDDKNFDIISISAGKYLVIARELIDGPDADTNSFETVWGNGDGVWDSNDGYNAVDGSLGLKNSGGDTIILKDNTGAIIESLTYLDNLANGNGKTLQLCEGSWIEAEATPGSINNCLIPEIQNETEQEQQESTTEENNTTTETDENNIFESAQILSVDEIENEQEKTAQNKKIEVSVIKLIPKTIKSDEDTGTSNKNNYAIYGFVIFCILLIFLFLLRRNKFKNEFN